MQREMQTLRETSRESASQICAAETARYGNGKEAGVNEMVTDTDENGSEQNGNGCWARVKMVHRYEVEWPWSLQT